ncbi:DUF1254 domain-containing protein [Denitratisoma oestradiolicum]|uniref:DUF1254 domain-containing protein n=1 Tax=Denitratisoma oestradiolicum TaxID=311182 RepID=A0A6S6Y4M8_9PROT|nr:DUF1254 domain-containing protein [Denitratisoma oestradiolicum]CAB1367558.1 conserved exported protein of unknown function [Denitratisoma oestradiolicum]
MRSHKKSCVLNICLAAWCLVGSAMNLQAAETVGRALSSQQNVAVPGQWNPLHLHKDVSPETARAYRREFDTQLATAGYLYALPAYLHAKQRYEFLFNFTRYMGDRGNPFDQFLCVRTPASIKTTDTMPNNDTLYGAAFLDLKASPMVLSVPDIPDRYYSFTLIDAYFYPFAYIGSRTMGQKAGNYLIVGPDWQGSVPAGIREVVKAPTPSINLYQRIYFRNLDDVPNVVKLQDQIRLTPLATFLDPAARVALPDPGPILKDSPLLARDPVEVLRIANRYMAENPPPVEDRSFLDHIAPIGIGPGREIPDDPRMLEVLRAGATAADHAMTALVLDGFPVRNGWQIPPADIGRRNAPGGIATQAMVQLRSIGINHAEEATYYTAYTDGGGQPLNGRQRYTLTFRPDEIPPLLKDKFGFWSLTLYDRTNGLFVDNPRHKYLVRSADPLVFGHDGSLTLLIQPEAPADPKLAANWLPAPAEGDFMLNLRVFVGGPAVVSGRYTPPPIKRQE